MCSICLDDHNYDHNHTIFELSCKHPFHLSCIMEWFRTSKKLSCPYCRQSLPLKTPHFMDGISSFYFFTRFRRMPCSVAECTHKEFPMNDQLCSAHQKPMYTIADIKQIIDFLFEYDINSFYWSISKKKKFIYLFQCLPEKGFMIEDVKNIIQRHPSYLAPYEVAFEYNICYPDLIIL